MTEKILNYHPDQGALGFEDVMLVPRHSDITSRYSEELTTSTTIARGLNPIGIPIISAGMDTVTGPQLAITLALQGGLGEVHRNNTPDEQAAIIREVKDRLRVVEDNPPVVRKEATILDVKQLLSKRKRGYVIVYEGDSFNGEFVGLATPRDLAAKEDDAPVSSVMTRRKRVKTVPQGTTLEQAVAFMKRHRLEKVPMVDEKGNFKGMYSMKDHSLYTKYPNAALDSAGRLMVGGAIGVKEIDVIRAHKLVEVGADVLFIDIAHGDSIHMERMMRRLKTGDDKVDVPIIIGNFAPDSEDLTEGEGVLFAYNIGADGIKVGVGPGFACKTRVVAGVGIPQITAIRNARVAMDKLQDKIPVIADGGVRIPHDVACAIAAGADAVMVGSLFAGTSDSPGEIITVDGRQMKMVRGMASAEVFNDRAKIGEVTTNADIYTHAAEGRTVLVPYTGETKAVIYELIGGLRSGMSYTNAHTICELQQAQSIRVTSAGSHEHTRSLG